jgi:class 3 adenylate cyclase
MTPLTFESFVLEDMSPEYREFSRRLSKGCQLIQYDPRNFGSSQRKVESLSMEDMAKDIEAVIDAIEADRVTIYGRGANSHFAIHLAARRPEIVDRLILYAPYTVAEEMITRDEIQGIAQLARGNWEMAARTLADLSSRREFGDKGVQNAAWYVKSTTGEDLARLFEASLDIDVSEELANISCPTLVLQPMNDPRWPPETGQQIAASIEGASFVPMSGGLHNFALGDPEPMLTAVLEFVGAERESSAAPKQQAFRTVLFTDLVEHTEMMSRLGDEKGREVLREHERITREVLKEHGGTEVKTMGDGFMASFGSVTSAVECAIGLQRAFEAHEGEPLSIRVGMNAGEPIEEEGDLFGATVILAARIAAKAEGGEILAADVVRGLSSGKGFLFADRGEFVAKGFEDPVRVYEVRWGTD